MRTLVIDTATQALSVALFEDDHSACTHEMVGRGHAERLLPAIAALPGGGRADRIAVDVGPGSFTGVRIGVAAARALAFAWTIPVAGYSALSMIAAVARRDHAADGAITVAITGGHGALFWQQFDAATLAPLAAFASTPIAQLAAQLDSPVIYGTGAEALVAARGSGTPMVLHPDARAFPLLPAEALLLPPRPLYGRGADAMTIAERLAQAGAA